MRQSRVQTFERSVPTTAPCVNPAGIGSRAVVEKRSIRKAQLVVASCREENAAMLHTLVQDFCREICLVVWETTGKSPTQTTSVRVKVQFRPPINWLALLKKLFKDICSASRNRMSRRPRGGGHVGLESTAYATPRCLNVARNACSSRSLSSAVQIASPHVDMPWTGALLSMSMPMLLRFAWSRWRPSSSALAFRTASGPMTSWLHNATASAASDLPFGATPSNNAACSSLLNNAESSTSLERALSSLPSPTLGILLVFMRGGGVRCEPQPSRS